MCAAPSARALEASWARVSEAFPALESAFFRRRSAGGGGRPGQAPSSSHRAAAAGASAVPPSPAVFPSSELGFLLEDYGQPGGVLGAEPADHLSAFSGDLSRFLRYSKLKVGARCSCAGGAIPFEGMGLLPYAQGGTVRMRCLHEPVSSLMPVLAMLPCRCVRRCRRATRCARATCCAPSASTATMSFSPPPACPAASRCAALL